MLTNQLLCGSVLRHEDTVAKMQSNYGLVVRQQQVTDARPHFTGGDMQWSKLKIMTIYMASKNV